MLVNINNDGQIRHETIPNLPREENNSYVQVISFCNKPKSFS